MGHSLAIKYSAVLAYAGALSLCSFTHFKTREEEGLSKRPSTVDLQC